MQLSPRQSGGWIPRRLVSATSTNGTSVSKTPTQLGPLHAYNDGGSAAYLKLYDKASTASVGTDIPVYVIGIPSKGCPPPGVSPIGLQFNNGLSIAVVKGIADGSTAKVTASFLAVSLGYCAGSSLSP